MKFPKYLRRKLPKKSFLKTENILRGLNINTICFEANCPNRFICYSKKCVTFLACGKKCTRKCSFCSVEHSKNPLPLDENEPKKIALAAKKLNLKHIVITMVTRDDLEDKGANHIALIIKKLKEENKNFVIETLTSDFSNRKDLIDIVLNQKADIFNYNIETTKRLTKKIRDKATYENSLKILQYVKNSKKTAFVKSGFMVGLGETEKEVFETIKDLKKAGCDIITIGQYISNSPHNYPIKAFIDPKQFKKYKNFAKEIGIKYIYASPFVRSSYNAGKLIK